MEATGTTRHLFTYGTLRRGAPMHGLLSEGVRFVGAAHASGRLYDMGAYPAFVDEATGGPKVLGDLFELVGDPVRLLDVLDRYEGEAFERVVREVVTADGRATAAFLYLSRGDPNRGRVITSGDYLVALANTGFTARGGRESPRD